MGYDVGRHDAPPEATDGDAGRQVKIGATNCEYSDAVSAAEKNDSRNEDNDAREMAADVAIAETAGTFSATTHVFSVKRHNMLRHLAD